MSCRRASQIRAAQHAAKHVLCSTTPRHPSPIEAVTAWFWWSSCFETTVGAPSRALPRTSSIRIWCNDI